MKYNHIMIIEEFGTILLYISAFGISDMFVETFLRNNKMLYLSYYILLLFIGIFVYSIYQNHK